jgi:CYTH domain-containing protein
MSPKTVSNFVHSFRRHPWPVARRPHGTQGDTEAVIERTPGRGQYAVTEREQRWLLRRLPEGLSDPVEVLDKYFSGSTLRLRRLHNGPTLVYKLGQKVRPDPAHPSVNQMTNMYLSEREFRLLGQVEGSVLSKTRWRWPVGERVFSVDQFDGPLEGLVLSEVEVPQDGADPTPPPLTVADLTEDDRFSGGHLASLSEPEAGDLLSLVAIMTGGD